MRVIRKDALKNKAEIEKKAKELFDVYGVNNVSMNRISKELNLGMATLYRHFEDKSALCYQLIQNDFYELFDSLNDINYEKRYSKRKKLELYIEKFLSFKCIHHDLLKCVEDKKDRKDYRNTEAYHKLFMYFHELLSTNHDEIWDRFKTDMFLNSLITQSYEYQRNYRGLSDEQITKNLISLFYLEGKNDE